MILKKIKEASLIGRSGSRFPVHDKWESFLKNGGRGYLICNAAEGEPGAFKDKFLLKNEIDRVFEGIDVVNNFFQIEDTFFYVKKKYYKLFKAELLERSKKRGVKIKLKEDRYVAGEETAAISSIEGKRADPKGKPPYPTGIGLWGKPTIVHNLETFYAISEIAKDNYNGERFFCITGDVSREGVFKLKEELSIKEVLQKTGNYPDFEFLVQAGGGAGGIFISEMNIDQPCNGLAVIEVYKKNDFDKNKKMIEISNFLMYGNCDKCTPCREGIYRINEMLKKGFDEKIFNELLSVLEKSSYCPLGKNASKVFKSLISVDEN